jgi:hypothetical protein
LDFYPQENKVRLSGIRKDDTSVIYRGHGKKKNKIQLVNRKV